MKLNLIVLFTLVARFTFAQASGLTTGPVTYSIPLTNPAATFYIDTDGIRADATRCGGAGYPVCPQIVQWPQANSYSGVIASDGTGNCYRFQISQLATGSCQNSFIGGAPGEYGALYGSGSSGWTTSPENGITLDEIDYPFTNWGGTAIETINGVDSPIQENYDMQAQIYHHSVKVWAPPAGRLGWRLITMQQIDSGSQVVITPMN